MKLEDLKSKLEENGYKIQVEKDIEHGSQIKLLNGVTINCFNNGKIQVQGKFELKNELETFFGQSRSSSSIVYEPVASYEKSINQVFVVYGHDKDCRDQLEAMLRRWGLDPLILDQLPSEGQTIIEKLENYTSKAPLELFWQLQMMKDLEKTTQMRKPLEPDKMLYLNWECFFLNWEEIGLQYY